MQNTDRIENELPDFVALRTAQKKEGLTLNLASHENGRGNLAITEIKDEDGVPVGIAYTKKKAGSNIPNGDGWIIKTNGGMKIYIIDAMGSYDKNGDGPRIITETIMAKEAGTTIAEDLFEAQKKLLEFDPNSGDLSRTPHIPYSAISGINVRQNGSDRKIEAAQLGNTDIIIIPSEGEVICSQNATAAGNDFFHGNLSYDEMLLAAENSKNHTALGYDRSHNESFDSYREYLESHYLNQNILTKMENLLKGKYEKITSEDLQTLKGEAIVILASDAIRHIPLTKLVEWSREVMSEGSAPKSIVERILTHDNQNASLSDTSEWLDSSIKGYFQMTKPYEYWQTATENFHENRSNFDSFDLGRLNHTDRVSELRRHFQKVEAICKEAGVSYNKQTINEFIKSVEDDELKTGWPSYGDYEFEIDGKSVYPPEVLRAMELTATSIPLYSYELGEVANNFTSFHFKDGSSLGVEWEDRLSYLTIIGKAFVRQIKPKMREMGINGEPDAGFVTRTLWEMLDKMQYADRYKEGISMINLEEYYQKIYEQWVEANIISDDCTIVAMKVNFAEGFEK